MTFSIGDEITVEKSIDRENTFPEGLSRWLENNDAHLEYRSETEASIVYMISLNSEEMRNQARISRLKVMLADTDYVAIKHSEGWITEEEYAPIKAQRQAWRDEINQLEEELSSMTDIQE